MNRIILIGNGFDLAHGLKTSYANFFYWYWTQRRRELINEYSKISEDPLCKLTTLDNNAWSISSYSDFIYCYNDGKKIFEELQNKEKYLLELSSLFDRICKSVETKGWVDIENEYYGLLKKFALEEDNETKVKKLNEQLQFIQDKLVEYLSWVNKIEVKPIESIKSAINAPFMRSNISVEGQQALDVHKGTINWEREFPLLPDIIMLLNFNYTKTAELYCPNDKHSFSINQIHGEVAKPESVIFGYGDEMDEKYKELVNKNDNLLLGNITSIKYLEADNYRKMLEFIEADHYQVCIMGHSCGNSDRTLLNTLFEHRNCVSIKPYYYKKKDGTDNYLDLVQNISRNFNDMKLMRDRVVNKKYCKPLTEP